MLILETEVYAFVRWLDREQGCGSEEAEYVDAVVD